MVGYNRQYFPGGNTPKGFYSYYDNIIGQKEAKRLICLKGGPGTGKSTIMKSIGRHFEKIGDKVDYLWCSADPDSLDGVFIKDRNAAVIDGTAPHIVDPRNPGAVDEIVNLGDYWNEEEIRKHRWEILDYGERISEAFKLAYVYLKTAGIRYEKMAVMLHDKENHNYVHKLDEIEDHIFKYNNTGIKVCKGFAGAITYAGIINKLPEIMAGLDEIYVIKTPVGYRTETILKPLADKMLDTGHDIELYYCPMDPGRKLEHIASRNAGIGIITFNDYHGDEMINSCKNIASIRSDLSDHNKEIYGALKDESKEDIDKAIKALKNAKTMHDELEKYYISNMDFEKIDTLTKNIIMRLN